MSTPNPTHIDIIAKAAGKVLWDADGTLNFRLNADIAAHVVSKLTDAGYSIVQSADAIELAQIVKELAYLTNQNQEFRDFYFGTYANSERWQELQKRAAAAAEGEKP